MANWSAGSVLNGSLNQAKALHARIVSGSIVLLTGFGLTTALNLAYNVVTASFLGPAGYGHVTVVYTVLTILSTAALAFQIVSSKVVAQQVTPEAKSQCYRVFHRAAWGCGLLFALLLFLFQRLILNYLNLPDPTLITWMAIGTAFFVPLGSRRGWIQGICGFRRLAISYVLEGAVRLGGAYVLIVMGFGLRGVVMAMAAAIAIAYFALTPKLAAPAPNPLRLVKAARETSQALSFYAGYMLITNFDIVLVKHLFSADMAGIYAAVALPGRVIQLLSAAVVNTMFPLVAGTGEKERKDIRVIATSLALVLGVGTLQAAGLGLTPPWIWTKFLGAGFAISGAHDLPYLAMLYAVKSMIYALSVVFITFEMSHKIANTSAMQLAFGVVLIAGVYEFHASLLETIVVQLALLSVLAVLTAIPMLADLRSGSHERSAVQARGPVRLIRKTTEEEVIAEFLKSDFSYVGYVECPKVLREMIIRPDFSDASENARRRALFLLRHYSLWKEIPGDVEWYEAEVNEQALEQVRVFPRAQWRKVARGNFSITRIVEDFHASRHKVDAKFFSKIQAIGEQLRRGNREFGAVLLLGLNEENPVTVLDGNHRLVASILSSPEDMRKLRFMCGLSQRMEECCWYKTNFATLFRYARHLFAAAIHNPKVELLRTLGPLHDRKHPIAPLGGAQAPVAGLVVEADDVRT